MAALTDGTNIIPSGTANPAAPITPTATTPPTTASQALTAPTAPVAPTTITSAHLAPASEPAYPATTSTPPSTALGASLAAFGSQLQGLSDSLSKAAPAPAATETAPVNSRQTILDRILGDTSTLSGKAADTAAANTANDIAGKTQKVNDLTNEYNTRSRYYDDQIRQVQSTNPQGIDATAAQEKVDQLTRQKNQELGNIAIQQSAANGDLTTAQTLAKQVVDDKYQPVQDEIDNLTKYYQLTASDMTDSEKLQAQAAIQAKQDTADEQKQKDLALYDQQIKQSDPLYQAQLVAAQNANGTNSASNGITVPITSSGKPDSTAQTQFLGQYSPDIQSLIKGIANYSINPTSISTRNYKGAAGLNQSQMLALVSQYDPTYDSKQYATRAAMQKNITSGQYSQTITAANTAVQHLSELSSDFSALGNGSVLPGLFNRGKNIAQQVGGSSTQNNFNITADAVASELAKIYKGTGTPTEDEINSWRSKINVNMSPAQFQGALATAVNLMGGKLSTLSSNYSSVMGQPGNFQILTDKNATTLQKLGIDPSSVDPTYGNSPTVKLQTFNGASTENAQVLQQVSQIAPNATPDEIVQLLQASGYQI